MLDSPSRMTEYLCYIYCSQRPMFNCVFSNLYLSWEACAENMCSFAITPCYIVTCSETLKLLGPNTSPTVGPGAASLKASGALLLSTVGMCFSLYSICNKYFTNTCCPWPTGPAEYFCYVCCYAGSVPKCFREKKASERLCKPAAEAKPKTTGIFALGCLI